MYKLIRRILRFSGQYRSRIQWAFLCSVLKTIFSKMPILFLYLVEAGQFYEVVKTDEND